MYELEKQFKEKLKIYFFCARTANPLTPQVINERFFGVVGYRQEDAFKRANEMYKDVPQTAIITHGDNTLIEDLLRNVKVEGVVLPPPLPQKPPQTIVQPMIGKEGLRAGLLYALDHYVKDEEKNKSLKKMVEEI